MTTTPKNKDKSSKKKRTSKKAKTAEKKGNPTANLPKLLELVKDSPNQLLKLEKFTDAELLAMGKDKGIKDIRTALNEAIYYCKFMLGEEIRVETYDTIKKYIKESYTVEFPEYLEIKKKKGVETEEMVTYAHMLNYGDVDVLLNLGKLGDETANKFRKFTEDTKGDMEHAKSQKSMIQSYVSEAKSIAHKREAARINAKYESLRGIWLEATGKQECDLLDKSEKVPEDKQILNTF